MCIESIQANQQSCPCCRSENYINVLNKKERGKVLELKVRCLNSVNGLESLVIKRDTLLTSVSMLRKCVVMAVVGITLVFCYKHMNKMNVRNDQ